jgi:DNA repair ATPase RecN
MEQHRKLAGKPHEELMRADELPAGARTSLMPEEPEQLLVAQRKLEKAAALKEELAAKVQALESEAIQAVLDRLIERVEHTCEEAQPKRLRVC